MRFPQSWKMTLGQKFRGLSPPKSLIRAAYGESVLFFLSQEELKACIWHIILVGSLMISSISVLERKVSCHMVVPIQEI